MKYLFFDIECANCNDRRGKIYSFGYIIADEGLNVIEDEKDIVMNPDVDKWDWYVLKNILAYSKKEVERKSKFNKHYNKIKRHTDGGTTAKEFYCQIWCYGHRFS